MKKTILILVGIFLVNTVTYKITKAQGINLIEKQEVYDKEHIPKKDPIPYPFVREADVMWEKTVWRMVNLREKMNHPLFFPTNPIGDRKNLVQLFLDVIENPDPGHSVYVYEADPLIPYEFERPTNLEKIYTKMNVVTYTEPVVDSLTGQVLIDPTTGKPVQKVTGKEIRTDDVTRLLVKEKWFFDRKYSTLNVRIIGICPIRIAPKLVNGIPDGSIDRTQLFWIYYPEFRYYLSRQEAFNPHNDAQPISFDDLLMQRRFSSYIFKESNVFNDRSVESYAKGMDAMFEAERIKQSIFEFEHDLWEY